MANNAPATIRGDIRSIIVPLTPRTISRSDNVTLEIEAAGPMGVVEAKVMNSSIGMPLQELLANRSSDILKNYRVKTIQCSREDGGIGVLMISSVYCVNPRKPYHVTYSVDMVEVQKSLKAHPRIRESMSALAEIQKWEATPEAVRTVFKGGSLDTLEAKYYADLSNPDISNLRKIKDEDALKYIKATVSGIESYNVYLPVVTKTSLYLKEPPGTSQDDDTHELKGTLDFSKGIGLWDDDFDFTVAGYDDSSDGRWFKSKDSYMQLADGTWQRTEEWTYTNDKKHDWIYEEA